MGVGLKFAVALVGAVAVSASSAFDQVLLPDNKELALIWQPAFSYPDSYHGFDGTGHVHRRSDIPAGPDGQGVHVGGNPAARSDALQRSDEFLKSTLDAR